MKRRIKCIVSSVACIALCIMTLSGCTFEGFNSKADYDVKTVTCVFNYGEIDKAEMDIYSSDGTVTKYIIAPYYDCGVNLFVGEIPPEYICKPEVYTISEEDWNSIVDAINETRFMELPNQLPGVEAFDGSDCYIKVETADSVHQTGGYCAGQSDQSEHQKFKKVRDALRNVTLN